MSEGKMTRGQWFVISDPTRQTILCDVGGPTRGNTTVAENCNPADATAIAALPDLIALADAVAAHFADTDAPLGARARAALAKAGVTK